MSVGIGVALIRLHDLPVEIPMREDADILRAVGERLHGVDRLRRNDDRLTGAEFHGFSGTDLDANPSDHRHRRMVVRSEEHTSEIQSQSNLIWRPSL